jgi:hypothetical protein
MAKADMYIIPHREELSRLCRSAASMGKMFYESGDKDDREAAPIYDLVFEAWKSLHEGESDAAGAIATLRADARERGLEPGLVEAVVEEMERVFLRGYKDTIMAAPAGGAPPKELDSGPELFARPMSLYDIYRHKLELGQPLPVEPSPDEADQERRDRTAVAIGRLSQGLTPPRSSRRSR